MNNQRVIIIKDVDGNIIKARKLNDKVINSMVNGECTDYIEGDWIVFKSLATEKTLMRVKLVNNWYRFGIVETPTTNC